MITIEIKDGHQGSVEVKSRPHERLQTPLGQFIEQKAEEIRYFQKNGKAPECPVETNEPVVADPAAGFPPAEAPEGGWPAAALPPADPPPGSQEEKAGGDEGSIVPPPAVTPVGDETDQTETAPETQQGGDDTSGAAAPDTTASDTSGDSGGGDSGGGDSGGGVGGE